MFEEIIYDLETQKLFQDIDTGNPADLGLSVISLYKRKIDKNYDEIEGKMYSFWVSDLSAMWPLFANVDRVIGFNSLAFDNLVLSPLCHLFDFSQLNHFDILAKVKQALGHRLSLNSIAAQTLGIAKTDVGTNAVLYWQKGDPVSLKKLESYCQADVDVTKQVYDFGLKNGYLLYKDKWNTKRKFEIDFSYQPQNNGPNQSQISLF